MTSLCTRVLQLGAVLAPLVLTHCRTSRSALVAERIGGVVHARPFASGTAYEAFFRAELAMLRHDYAQAAQQMELATFADESDGWLAARRAEFFLLSGDLETALQGARESTQRFPRQAATWLVLGEVLTATGAQADATAAFSRALQEAPDDPEVRATVAIAQGSLRFVAENARENAPEARPGDRTIAQRSLLDSGRDARPTLASVRRERAHTAMRRGAWSEVDALLTPLVASSRATQQDRIRLIDARANDGRASSAVALVSSISTDASLSPTELARLWLLVERPSQALETLQRAPINVGVNHYLHGLALDRTGAREQALLAWARIAPADLAFVDAQIAAANALSASSHTAWGALVLTQAIARLSLPSTVATAAEARDRLRAARAVLTYQPDHQPALAADLEAMETPWGRQQRAILLAEMHPGATEQNLVQLERDLRERSSSPVDDARAAANLAILCALRVLRCDSSEAPALVQRALSLAAQDPATLRAQAVLQSDPSTRSALLRSVAIRSPRSPLNEWLFRHFARLSLQQETVLENRPR